MVTDEEYLDNLLKNIIENEPEQTKASETDEENENDAILPEETREMPITSDELADMLDRLDDIIQEQPEELSMMSELEVSPEPDEAMLFEEPENNDIEKLLSQTELDAMFAQMDESITIPEPTDDIKALFEEDGSLQASNELEAGDDEAEADDELEAAEAWEMPVLPEEAVNSEDTKDPFDMDIGDLIDGLGADEELSEIKGLLDKAENNELVEDDDMLALLDGAGEYGEKNGTEDNDEIMALLNMEEPEEAGTKKDKKQDKKKSNRRKSNKKKGDAEEEQQDGVSLNEFGEIEQASTSKKGFFGKMFATLTDVDEEEEEPAPKGKKEVKTVSEENQEILDDLEEEDQTGKKGKKGKKEKKEKKSKKAPAPKKKPAKAKPVKKKKESTEPIKYEKRVSNKKKMLVFVFCMTLLAAIITVCRFMPDFQERAEARTAYYKNDYKEVYDLFYNKSLSSSDEVMFNQAFVILQMERKEESYRNYKEMNMPIEALNALLQGVSRYQQLSTEDLYGAQDKVFEIYQNILNILVSEYDISEQDALSILAYDSKTYTQKVHAVALGTDFEGNEGESESQMPDQPQDILPEEEDIIQ